MKISVLFPSFLGGGAEAVAAWMCQVLLESHDVTLITCSTVDLATIDEQYGTALSHSRLRVEVVELPVPGVIRARIEKSLSAFAFRQFALMRHYKRKFLGQYDLPISAFNEMDFGERGIQYVHLPMFGRGLEGIRSTVGHPDSLARRLYREILRQWSGYSQERMKQNFTITNSRWTAGAIRRAYGVDSRVVYPPVTWCEPVLPWEQRKDAVVVVSRIVREKRIERAIEIVKAVRQRGVYLELYLVGGSGDPDYEYELRARYGNADWIRWEPRMSRKDYERFLGQFKYGLHTRKNEQFGIGIAEMVVAGMIPFVPADGGQAEIVRYDELLWNTEEEAVEKICRIGGSTALQKNLRYWLQREASRWHISQFQKGLLKCVEDFLTRHRGK